MIMDCAVVEMWDALKANVVRAEDGSYRQIYTQSADFNAVYWSKLIEKMNRIRVAREKALEYYGT